MTLGYEDVNDHEQLRHDPLMGVLAGKREVGEESLAGKSTLNRLELGPKEKNRYRKIRCQQEAIDELLTTIFLESQEVAPERIVLDLARPLPSALEGRTSFELLLFPVDNIVIRQVAQFASALCYASGNIFLRAD